MKEVYLPGRKGTFLSRKRTLLYIILLCFICVGCGSRDDLQLQGNNNIEGSQKPSNSVDAVVEPESTFADNSSDYESSMTRTVECSSCHGDGICSHCDGDAFRNGRRCRVCNGTGDCGACEGVGLLEVHEIDGMDYTVCTGCHGSGACGVCDGTGRIVHQYSTLGRVDRECSLCHGSGNCVGCKGTGLRRLAGF